MSGQQGGLVQERVGNFLGWTDQPERRGEVPLPNGTAVKGRSTPAEFPAKFPASGDCAFHLGFGLVAGNLCNDGLIGPGPFLGHTGLIPDSWRQSPNNLEFHPSFQRWLVY